MHVGSSWITVNKLAKPNHEFLVDAVLRLKSALRIVARNIGFNTLQQIDWHNLKDASYKSIEVKTN